MLKGSDPFLRVGNRRCKGGLSSSPLIGQSGVVRAFLKISLIIKWSAKIL